MDPAPMQRGLDLPAVQIEDSVGAAVREMLDDESSILQTVQDPDTDSTRVEDVLRAARTWSRLVQSEVEKTAALATLECPQPISTFDEIKIECSRIVPQRSRKSRTKSPTTDGTYG